jgi:hypothetical protein
MLGALSGRVPPVDRELKALQELEAGIRPAAQRRVELRLRDRAGRDHAGSHDPVREPQLLGDRALAREPLGRGLGAHVDQAQRAERRLERPPSAAASFPSAARGSGRCSSSVRQKTRSNAPGSSGSLRTSRRRTSTWGRSMSSRKRTSRSAATTRPAGPTWCASRRLIEPVAAPTSRQRPPRGTPIPPSQRRVSGSSPSASRRSRARSGSVARVDPL